MVFYRVKARTVQMLSIWLVYLPYDWNAGPVFHALLSVYTVCFIHYIVLGHELTAARLSSSSSLLCTSNDKVVPNRQTMSVDSSVLICCEYVDTS